eukprot:527374-Rhodomonas_salina.1
MPPARREALFLDEEGNHPHSHRRESVPQPPQSSNLGSRQPRLPEATREQGWEMVRAGDCMQAPCQRTTEDDRVAHE